MSQAPPFSTRAGRPPIQRGRVLAELRRAVATGLYRPGSRFPTRAALCERFDVSSATLQEPMDQLRVEGFIEVQGPTGTFVSRQPPHLHNVAVVYAETSAPSLFLDAIRLAARRVAGEYGFTIGEYRTCIRIGERGDVERLCDDVANHRLQAVVFAGLPHQLEGTPAMDHPGVFRVAISGPIRGSDIPAVGVDADAWRRAAVADLKSRGRKRIAHLVLDDEYMDADYVPSLLRAADPDFRSCRGLVVGQASTFRTARLLVSLAMQLTPDLRPDALIIHDDNFVEHALAALLSLGVRVPNELDIVAHANFPAVAPSPLPLRRLGYDCRVLVRRCFETIRTQQGGEAVPSSVNILPIWENELPKEPAEAPITR